ncbi:MAG: DUF1772 domain-containing protein [Nocardioidaceae bacterium]
MDVLRTASLLLATLSTGLMAGVFGLYAHTIMPGLGKTDDKTFVGAFASIDRAIINPWFLGGGFLGALVATVVATLSHLGRSNLGWVAGALALYLITFVITVVVHLPLNDALKAAGNPDRIADLASVRERFDEARWRNWNVVRAWTSTAAFAILCWTLVLHSR